MKNLIILFSLLSVSVFGGDRENPHQSANLTDYNSTILNGYSAGINVEEGTYTLIRDSKTPKRVRLKIHKTYSEIVHFKMGQYDATDYKKDNIMVELNFEESAELLESDTEKIVIELDFRSGRVDLYDVSISSDDSDRGYHVDKDTWGIPSYLQETYEFRAVKE